MNQYPVELTHTPVHVIALAYLQEYHKHISTCLSDLFDSLAVLSFANEGALPLKKAKKSFDGYRPQGLMKRGWMRKHQVRSFLCAQIFKIFFKNFFTATKNC